MKAIATILVSLFVAGLSLANPPKNLRVVPGAPDAEQNYLDGERATYIAEIGKTHRLDLRDSTLVYFSEAGEHNFFSSSEIDAVSTLTNKLIQDWAQTLGVKISDENEEIISLANDHDLTLREAQLVYLAHLTKNNPGAAQVDTLTETYSKALIGMIIKKRK